MKRSYIAPSFSVITIRSTQVLAMSGGLFGETGDAAESQRFCGNVIDEEEFFDEKMPDHVYEEW